MSTLPYLITDSLEEFSYENAQCSLQKKEKTEKCNEPNNSKGKQLKKQKLESVHKYLNELSDELETSKFSKRCKEDAY
ncbi:18581_t:CDS:2 [Racocetra persica]|uniref:18581_t:CDS:1 n=1 Tax=Racocetra persica TaxID=160502 RepID=A0ACA9M8P8_9GLOM|nr:18581_t:CDS:2 [Racocetra persica]